MRQLFPTDAMYLVLIVCVSSVGAVINPRGPTIVSDYVNCIGNLINENFDKPGLLIFANTNDTMTLVFNIRSELLKRIHHSMKFIVKITTPDKSNAICNKENLYDVSLVHMYQRKVTPLAKYYVIIVDNHNDFSFLASKIVKSRYWNPYAKFIVLVYSYLIQGNLEYVEDILTCLFKYNVIEVIVIVPDEKNIRIANIYSWRPYDPPQYCGYFNETAHGRLIVDNICKNGILKYKKSMFKNKLPKNMQKCKLYILALERNPFMSRYKYNPNIEKDLVEALLRKFNFSSKYTFINVFRGEREDTGEWNGALSEIVSKKSHILLGGIFPDFDVHEDFDCSSSYLADSYTWVVPRANPSPPWVALTIIYNISVWCSAITGFILCVFTWKLLGQLSGDSLYNKTLDHCSLNTLIICLGFSAYTRPAKESLRIFFVFLNIYCMILLTAYQTKLIIVLQNPAFDQQIDTVEDLVLSGLKFGGFEELQDLFFNSSDPFDNAIGERWIVVDNITNALIDVTVHKNFSVLCSRLELAHLSSIMPELNDAFGKYTYFALNSNMFTVPMEMISLRGFPFMNRFSHFLNLYKQLGINEGVRRRFRFNNKKNRTKLLIALNEHHDKFNPLTLEHLQSGFFALGLGAVIGTVVLFLEILVSILTIN